MWPFKATEESTEKRLRKVQERLNSIEEQLMDIAHSQDILRDKVLRKLQERRKKGQEEDEEEVPGLLPTKDLSSRVGI